MGLLAREVSLHEWRNFPTFDIGLGEGLTILYGQNAVGKTNVVEALQLLTAGMSFRRPAPRQLVREGCDRARAETILVGDGRVIEVSCDVEPPRRVFRRNGKRVHASELSGTLMSVLFCPDDLALVKRGASSRRDELDDFGRQVNGGYARVLRAYRRSIEQRNRLLRDDACDPALMAAWDESVALGGATLLEARLRLVRRLFPLISAIYGELSNGEELCCRYACTLGDDVFDLGRDALAERLGRRLAAGRDEDLRRAQTCVGPHRDDLRFLVAGRDARTYASQGQQRSIVLAWKMAEVLLCEELSGTKPLLLLDDVMSELDGRRRAAATRFVSDNIQAVVTTTNLGYFPDDLLPAAKVVRIDA